MAATRALPGRLLLVLAFGGLFLGGLRDPWLWALAASSFWLAALFLDIPFDRAALRPWLPWLGWAALSAAFSDQPLKSLPALSRWAGALGFFAAARAVWGDDHRALWLKGIWLAAPILGAAAFITGWGVLVGEGSGEWMWGFMPPYYNYTMFALTAAVAAGLAALAHPQAPKGRGRILLWALLAVCLAVLLVARARTALLALAAGAVAAALRRGRFRQLAVGAAAVLLLGVAVTGAMMARRKASAGYLLKLDKLSSFKRPQLWAAAARVVADKPLFGEGIGNFEQGFRRHNFPSGRGISNYQFATAHAHSEPLQAAAETGLIGLLLWAGALVWSWARAWRRAGPGLQGECALDAGVAMSVFLLVDNMLHVPGLALLYLSALAIATPEKKTASKHGHAWALAAGLILTVAGPVPQMLSERSPQAAAAIFPSDAAAHEDYARALIGKGRFDAALVEIQAASNLEPTNAPRLALWAELLRQKGDWGGVYLLAQRAIALEPNFLQARLLRAESLARAGRKSEARAELEDLARRREAIRARGFGVEGQEGLFFGYDRQIGAYDESRAGAVGTLTKGR